MPARAQKIGGDVGLTHGVGHIVTRKPNIGKLPWVKPHEGVQRGPAHAAAGPIEKQCHLECSNAAMHRGGTVGARESRHRAGRHIGR